MKKFALNFAKYGLFWQCFLFVKQIIKSYETHRLFEPNRMDGSRVMAKNVFAYKKKFFLRLVFILIDKGKSYYLLKVLAQKDGFSRRYGQKREKNSKKFLLRFVFIQIDKGKSYYLLKVLAQKDGFLGRYGQKREKNSKNFLSRFVFILIAEVKCNIMLKVSAQKDGFTRSYGQKCEKNEKICPQFFEIRAFLAMFLFR